MRFVADGPVGEAMVQSSSMRGANLTVDTGQLTPGWETLEAGRIGGVVPLNGFCQTYGSKVKTKNLQEHMSKAHPDKLTVNR